MLERLEAFSLRIEESQKEISGSGSEQFRDIQQKVKELQNSLQENEDLDRIRVKSHALQVTARGYADLKENEKKYGDHKKVTQIRIDIAQNCSKLSEEFGSILDGEATRRAEGKKEGPAHPANNVNARADAIAGLRALVENSQRNIWGKGSQEFRDLQEAVNTCQDKTRGNKDKELEALENLYMAAQRYINSKAGKKLNTNGETRMKIADSVQKYVVTAMSGLGKRALEIETIKRDIATKLRMETANKGAKQKAAAKPAKTGEPMLI